MLASAHISQRIATAAIQTDRKLHQSNGPKHIATAAIFANRFLVLICETVSWMLAFTMALDPSMRQPPAAPVPPPASHGPYDDNAACISDRLVNSCQPALQPAMLTGRGFDIGAISRVRCQRHLLHEFNHVFAKYFQGIVSAKATVFNYDLRDA